MSSARWLAPRTSVPYAVLVVTLVLTAAGTYYVSRTNRMRDELAFRTAAAETRHLVQIRLNTYIELLRAAAALFAASDDVRRDEFRAFVTPLRLRERYPGIQGVGFARRVPSEEVADPGRRLDRLVLDDLRVWPPGLRDEYTSIIFLEPLDDRNQAALGFDMFTEPVRRAAMARARDTGEPAASGKVTLVQEIDEAKQAGFLIYMPVYQKGLPVTTVEERRAAHAGYVYSPFRANDLLSKVVAPREGRWLEYEVFDGPSADPVHLLHTSPREAAPSLRDGLHGVERLDVAGRPWTIVLRASRDFGGSPAWLVPVTLGTGLIIAFALFGITLSQVRGWEQAERHASERRGREQALRESEARLRRLVVLEREARAEAQAADRAKDEFLATLSHELRTPLNAMLGWISMLRSGKVRRDRRAEALEVIERNARAQARLIEDLLDVSRIITGKVRVELHPVQLGPIAETVVETLRPGADAKGVEVRVDLASDIGPVMGDAARLQQIVWNLLSNAIKFTPPGGQVQLAADRRGGEVELRVRDTGVGISADFLPHVFERFRQADSSTTRSHSGVGLGLAIVRHLVELHGGRISAHSEGPDCGALFAVRLPAAAQERVTGRADSATPVVDLDGLRVLVVDDDEDTRQLLSVALAAAGARVATAASAAEALHIVQTRGADALVSDIAMPDLDGYALIRQVRQLSGSLATLPAVALSAYARPEDRAQAIDAGFQLHFAKPVDLDALQAALGRLAASRAAASSPPHQSSR